MEKTIKKGARYRHYSQKLYRVHDVVRHSETLEELVLYEALYENDLCQFWVRPLSMFLETVTKEGKSVPRFEFVSET